MKTRRTGYAPSGQRCRRQPRSNQPPDRALAYDHVGAALHFLVKSLERMRGPDLLPVPGPQSGERQQVFAGVCQHGFDFGRSPGKHAGDHDELVTNHLGLGLGEDRADRGGDHLRAATDR